MTPENQYEIGGHPVVVEDRSLTALTSGRGMRLRECNGKLYLQAHLGTTVLGSAEELRREAEEGGDPAQFMSKKIDEGVNTIARELTSPR